MTEWYRAIRTIRLHGQWMTTGVIGGICIATLIFMFQPHVWQAEMIIAPTTRAHVPVSGISYYNTAAADSPAMYQSFNHNDQSSDFALLQAMMLSPAVIHAFHKSYPDVLKAESRDDLYLYLKKNVKIRPYGQTPYSRVTLNHHDRQNAANILAKLYEITDKNIRQNEKIRVQQRIAYLESQLGTVLNPTHRSMVLALLREQEQTAMMVSIDQAFAGSIVSAAHVHPTPVSPSFLILCPVLAFVGGLIGFMVSGFVRASRAFKLRNIVRPSKKMASNTNANISDGIAKRKIVNR